MSEPEPKGTSGRIVLAALVAERLCRNECFQKLSGDDVESVVGDSVGE